MVTTTRSSTDDSEAAIWRSVLERAEKHGHLPPQLRLRLYSDGTYMHGTPACMGVQEAQVIEPRDVFELTMASWCDCNGWLSARLGIILGTLRSSYEVQDADRAGVHDQTWQHLWKRLHTRTAVQAYEREDDVGIKEQVYLRDQANQRIARRTLAYLDTHDLERAIAAQGLRLPVVANEAGELVNWAKTHRALVPLSARDLVRYAMFEHALDKVMADAGSVLVGVRGSGPRDEDIDTGLPVELSLFLWSQGTDTRSTTFMHFLRPVAEGLNQLAARDQRVLLASIDEHDRDVLEIARTLLDDRGDTWDEERHTNLDEIMHAARTLMH